MRVLRFKGGIVLGSVVLTIALGASVASAVVTSQLLVDRADAYMRVVRTEATDGFDSGWHTHPGPAIVQVQEGSFTIQQGCETTVVGPGETYIETPELAVRAVADATIKWTTTLIVPKHAAFAAPASAPTCP